jgi:hypothetical protein
MHRRRFLRTAAIAGATGALALDHAGARQATPASPTSILVDGFLAGRVAQVRPQDLYAALVETPVTTPLFPAGTPPVEPVAWEDPSDADLDGVVGGVVFNTGFDDNDNYLGVGTAIVHPDPESAVEAFEQVVPTLTQTFLWLPWFVHAGEEDAVSVARVDYLLLIGGTDAPVGEAASPATMTLRAITHMTALLDHLDSVLTKLGR